MCRQQGGLFEAHQSSQTKEKNSSNFSEDQKQIPHWLLNNDLLYRGGRKRNRHLLDTRQIAASCSALVHTTTVQKQK